MNNKCKNHKVMLDFIFAHAIEGFHWEGRWNKTKQQYQHCELSNESYILICHIYKTIEIDDWYIKEIFESLSLSIQEHHESLHLISEKSESIRGILPLARWHSLETKLISLKTKILSSIEKNLYEIKIEINERENPEIKGFIDSYQSAIDLYNKGEYESAIQKARDVFQKDIESLVGKKGIRYFEKYPEGTIQFEFNKILKSITNIRNMVKTAPKTSLNNMQAFSKLLIEQLINVRNFVEISKKE